MKINIEGKRFGRLIAIEFTEYSKAGARWDCKCDCGNVTNVYATHLRRGKIVSCGCYRLERVKKALFKDLTGKRFGRLIVIKVSKNNDGCYYWECLCNCGNKATIAGNKLTFKHTRSCGCLMRDVNAKKMKKLALTQKGKNHPRWNPNISDSERRKKRKEFKESKWRNKVYKRDNYTCQKCDDKRGGNLNAHHIYSWITHPKLRNVTDNGITFCEECHKKFHKKHGYGKNTRKQLTGYL